MVLIITTFSESLKEKLEIFYFIFAFHYGGRPFKNRKKSFFTASYNTHIIISHLDLCWNMLQKIERKINHKQKRRRHQVGSKNFNLLFYLVVENDGLYWESNKHLKGESETSHKSIGYQAQSQFHHFYTKVFFVLINHSFPTNPSLFSQIRDRQTKLKFGSLCVGGSILYGERKTNSLDTWKNNGKDKKRNATKQKLSVVGDGMVLCNFLLMIQTLLH